MADVKLNSLATKTNANAAAILVKDSATQNQGAEGWITKAQLSQIIRDEIKAQMSAITSGSPDVPVLDGNTLKYMTLANFAKVVGEQHNGSIAPGSNVEIPRGVYLFGQAYYGFGLASFGQSTIDDHTNVQTKLNISFERVSSATIRVTNNRSSSVYTYYKLLWYLP